MIFETLYSPATKCNIHGVSGSIPREGEAQSDQPSVAALWSGGAGIAANVISIGVRAVNR